MGSQPSTTASASSTLPRRFQDSSTSEVSYFLLSEIQNANLNCNESPINNLAIAALSTTEIQKRGYGDKLHVKFYVNNDKSLPYE